MHALLAFRRPNPEVPLGFDVGFELRQMTCFNGFNQQNAFRTVTPPRCQDLNLVLIGGQPSDAFYNGDATNHEARPWEFIALGWMSETVVTKANYTSFLEARRSLFSGLEWMGQILNREHITGSYKDWNTDTFVPGMRDRTPNEVFLGDLLARLQRPSATGWSEGFETCKVAWALQGRANFHYSLYDFVGSERPSGLAVAYLQVYRNVSRVMLGTNRSQESLVTQTRDLCLQLDSTLSKRTYHSFIPVLSAMINNGSDSDIFTFTTASALPLQILKYGTFSISEFMNNSIPMSREGKYVKGSQSSGLSSKIASATTRSGQQVPDIGLSQLSTMRSTLNTFSACCDVSRLQIYGVESFISVITNQFAALRRMPNVAQLRVTLGNAVAGFNDLRAPIAPTARIAGAASGFLQWAEQSAAAVGTVH